MEPTTKTIDSYIWSNLPHTELKDYGKRYRIEQLKNPETTFLNDNREKILECFGIGEDDAKYWEICTTFDLQLKIKNQLNDNTRLEDGSYSECEVVMPLFTRSPYQHFGPHTSDDPTNCSLCYKYFCDMCERRFNTNSCVCCGFSSLF